MSSLLGRLAPHARLAFSLGGLFMSPSSPMSSITAATRDAAKTKYVLRPARVTDGLQREVPTPLVFVSSAGWDKSSAEGMESFASMFSERGYTCLELDLAKPSDTSTSTALMKHYESEMSSHIRLMTIPFAPVIVARGGGTLIAQTFVESNPASGLILISPPESNDSVTASSSASSTSTSLLSDPLPEFKYEPLFPLAVVGTPPQLATLRARHRLFTSAPKDESPKRNRLFGALTGRGGRGRWSVDALEVDQVDGQQAFVEIEKWLDNVGV